ncbi:MAG: helix-hairpin-helix domain-containing protein [bacterium]|nr:helix-hairpin-helix domain-containing protein [bacterium]
MRLYFVDCPETTTSAKADAERVREQSRYFGLAAPARVIFFGNEAKKFTSQILSKPFTVQTAFASAPGRSAQGRIYGFVTTSEGYDLGTLLVKSGLARAKGIGRESADGTKRLEITARLQDLENAAMLKRAGIWAETDPNRLADFRSQQRREDQELKEIQENVEESPSLFKSLDINTATAEELQTIKGIGPVLAERIIAGRPYKTVDDLLKVNGIGYQKLDKIRPFCTIKSQ